MLDFKKLKTASLNRQINRLKELRAIALRKGKNDLDNVKNPGEEVLFHGTSGKENLKSVLDSKRIDTTLHRYKKDKNTPYERPENGWQRSPAPEFVRRMMDEFAEWPKAKQRKAAANSPGSMTYTFLSQNTKNRNKWEKANFKQMFKGREGGFKALLEKAKAGDKNARGIIQTANKKRGGSTGNWVSDSQQESNHTLPDSVSWATRNLRKYGDEGIVSINKKVTENKRLWNAGDRELRSLGPYKLKNRDLVYTRSGGMKELEGTGRKSVSHKAIDKFLKETS